MGSNKERTSPQAHLHVAADRACWLRKCASHWTASNTPPQGLPQRNCTAHAQDHPCLGMLRLSMMHELTKHDAVLHKICGHMGSLSTSS